MELVIHGLVPLSYNSRNVNNKKAYSNRIRSAFLRKYKGAVPRFPADEEYMPEFTFLRAMG
jgi:hypothetical protein